MLLIIPSPVHILVHMGDLVSIKKRLEEKRAELAKYEEARLRIVGGAQSYSFRNGDDQRSVENVSLASLNSTINALKSEIAELENRVALGGRTGRTVIIGGAF